MVCCEMLQILLVFARNLPYSLPERESGRVVLLRNVADFMRVHLLACDSPTVGGI